MRISYHGNVGGGAGWYSPRSGGNYREHRAPSPLMSVLGQLRTKSLIFKNG